MAKNSRYMTGQPRRVSIALDSDTLRDLDQIAPDNIGEAVRFCIQHALAAGAVFKATTQHTGAQCHKHQQRYQDNAAPLPTTYGGHVMTARPAPATPVEPLPIQTAEAIYMDRKAAEWVEANEPRMVGALVTERAAHVAPQPMAPQVVHTSTPSAAALAAVAAIALTDDEIKALDPSRGGQQPFVG